MPTDPQSVDSIFLVALEKSSPEGRAAYLDVACGENGELRSRVERLLDAHPKVASFLESPAPGISATIAPLTPEQIGTYIGSYKLREEIGEGGMGSVYMATQKEPIRRKVALKVIKAGMDSKQVVSRFEAERQALAMMDHPNIARVIDGGTTESGRPYFVMELVRGIPITKYCDRYRLTTDERLELFEDVCSAVQHAHQKGIIHRDLKPSNILVTVIDGKAIPKVIDFGIAKATSGHITDESLVTAHAQMVGTPMYMSPEQADVSGVDVDTRSDVYSLGVLLYELLTGTTPFDRKRLKEVSYDEFRRIVKEEEPPRPSTRLSTLDAALETLADKHQTDPRTLSQQVSGELDWIVMKSLEKDRAQRYESANELAKDVQRYLDDEAVEACPPSNVYRLKKFARRNKATMLTVASVALALVLGLFGTTWQAILATQAEERERNQAEIADEQHQAAQANYVRAREAVRQMLTRVADEELAVIPEMKEVRKQLLKDAAAFYTELIKLNGRDPMAYSERGHVYDLLAQFGKALADYEKAVELDPDNQKFHNDLSWFLYHCAEVSYRDLHRALVHAKRAIELNPHNSDFRVILARVHVALKCRDEALADIEKAMELSPDSPNTQKAVGEIYLSIGDTQKALAYVQTALKLDPGNAEFHRFLAQVFATLGENEKALAAINKAIEVNPKPNSTQTFYMYDQRGGIYWRLGMQAAALADFSQSLELASFRSYTYKRRALAYFHFKDYAKALADIAKAVELRPTDLTNLTWISPSQVAACPDESFRDGLLKLADKSIELNDKTARAYAARGWILATLGQEEKALEDLKTAFAGLPNSDESGELGFSETCYELGNLCGQLAHRREVIPYLAKMAELQPESPVHLYRAALAQLGAGEADSYGDVCRRMVERFQGSEKSADWYWTAWTCLLAAEAVEDYAPVVRLTELAVEADPDSEAYLNTLGAILYRAGQAEEAVQRLAEANDLIKNPEGESTSSPAYNWYFLAMAHQTLDNDEEAETWLQKANAWTDKVVAEHEEGTATVAWNRRLTLKLLREEAEGMIGTPDQPEDDIESEQEE